MTMTTDGYARRFVSPSRDPYYGHQTAPHTILRGVNGNNSLSDLILFGGFNT